VCRRASPPGADGCAAPGDPLSFQVQEIVGTSLIDGLETSDDIDAASIAFLVGGYLDYEGLTRPEADDPSAIRDTGTPAARLSARAGELPVIPGRTSLREPLFTLR
jgi:hypothetical protein